MTQREIDHIRTRESWRKIIAEQKESGLTAPEFCQQKRISIHAFRYWRTAITKELIADAKLVGIHNAPASVPGSEAVAAAAEEAIVPVDPAKELRDIREKAVEIILDKAEAPGAAKDSVQFKHTDLRQHFNQTYEKNASLMHWLENKYIIGYPGSGFRHQRKLYVNREQWNQIKDELLDGEETALTLIDRLPKAEVIAPAPVAEVVEQKNIDTQMELSVDGVVFDMEHNRLYVPGTATEKTIRVAISILKGLIPQTVEPTAVLA